ncbi:ribosomal RNA small subunit methyltransferase A [Caldanaerobacter subterraneus]|uniref:Dimethyladenosine transferase (RRNA methylation) n=1 Tax=Caldanaerobacter subterraneus subsp. pacificus DSM 12653 TaxID=391606 RepID=A0A0F5PR07_9THEO|nr:rRNA adenine N-6-methyltransferase family protein [Caldanaerobacter subterraneus]KKC30841.1 dimethyladenosine transferase (rRNA methylation) [Caldanaerobacter subterraneus subsp. pacificus DSM 12653]
MGGRQRIFPKSVKKVVSFEIDKELFEMSRENSKIYKNVVIINEDIPEVDLFEIAQEQFVGNSFKVVANLPYYTTSPIIMKMLHRNLLKVMTVLVQKEVGARICALPGTKDFGMLPVFVKFKAKPEILLNLPPKVFAPPPKVESSLLKLKVYHKPLVEVTSRKALF